MSHFTFLFYWPCGSFNCFRTNKNAKTILSNDWIISGIARIICSHSPGHSAADLFAVPPAPTPPWIHHLLSTSQLFQLCQLTFLFLLVINIWFQIKVWGDLQNKLQTHTGLNAGDVLRTYASLGFEKFTVFTVHSLFFCVE